MKKLLYTLGLLLAVGSIGLSHAEDAKPASTTTAVETKAPDAPAATPATPPAPSTSAPSNITNAQINSGDTAWMLTSTALVLMMTIPGLALFYAGMVRKK